MYFPFSVPANPGCVRLVEQVHLRRVVSDAGHDGIQDVAGYLGEVAALILHLRRDGGVGGEGGLDAVDGKRPAEPGEEQEPAGGRDDRQFLPFGRAGAEDHQQVVQGEEDAVGTSGVVHQQPRRE